MAGSEADLQKRIQTHVRAQGAYSVKYHGGRFSIAGTADLLIAWNGFFYAIEVKKSPKELPETIQIQRQTEVIQSGSVSFVVDGMERVISIFQRPPMATQFEDVLSPPFWYDELMAQAIAENKQWRIQFEMPAVKYPRTRIWHKEK